MPWVCTFFIHIRLEIKSLYLITMRYGSIINDKNEADCIVINNFISYIFTVAECLKRLAVPQG